MTRIIYFSKILTISLIINAIALFFAARRVYFSNHVEKVNFRPWSLDRKSIYNLFPVSKNDIVFIGDSQVQLFDLQEFFPDQPLKNRGIGGDVTSGVYNRILPVLYQHPKKIFVEVGTNDIYSSLLTDTSVYYMAKIISAAKIISPETKLYIQSVLPREPKFKIAVINLNQKLKNLCAKNGVEYVDLYSKFQVGGSLNKAYDGYDGLHLSAEGYIEWANTVKKYLL